MVLLPFLKPFWLFPVRSVLFLTSMFPNDFEKIFEYKDSNGRLIITFLKTQFGNFLVSNLYCPSDHKLTNKFIEETYTKILKVNSQFPDSYLIIGGDQNTCITGEDFLNRNKTKVEHLLAQNIVENNVCKVTDTYRHLHPKEGYTWRRGNC